MTGKEFDLTQEGRRVKAVLERGSLYLDGSEVKVASASLDTSRRMPFWAVTLLIASVLTIGVFASVAVHSLLFSPILVLLAVSISLFIFMATGRMRTVLKVTTGPPGQTIELSGERSDLSRLHFELAKLTLGDRRKRDREGTLDIAPKVKGGPRTGATRSEAIMGQEEASRLKENLRKGLVSRDRIVARTCPHCESTDLYIEAGMYGGAIYHCKDCDYVGPFIIEREIIVR